MQWTAETLTTALSSLDESGGSPLILPVEEPATLSAQKATTFAIIYGLPFFPYSKLASKLEEQMGEFKTNAFYHQDKLVDADFDSVVWPNMDTLYSEALVDLSSNDLVVTIPKVKNDRFYVFPVYDAYGNNVVNIGTAGVSTTPGRYLLTYQPANPGYSPDDTYTGCIHLPTPYGGITLRILVNGPDDVKEVNALQAQFTLTSKPISFQVAPKLTKSLLFDGLSTDLIERILQQTARFSQFNLPEVGSEIAKVTTILNIAGLSRGSYTTPSGVDLNSAMADAVATIVSVKGSQFDKYFRRLGNNWSQLRDIYSGDFKDHYTARAFVAEQGYLQLKVDQAVYPIYDVPGGLTSDNSYTVTFSRKPPVNGFWSLTVYNEKGFFVANQWKVYALGDRSDIKYPDGHLVYPRSGRSDTDGEFTILLQTLDVLPPKKYRSNWIPTPANGAPFNFVLRWYAPTTELRNGEYEYPTVKALEPVKAD